MWSGREWTNLLVFHSLQSVVCDDVIEVVNHYVVSSDPPLTPALGKSFETQISIPDEPPDYDNANRVLKVKREASVITHELRVFPSSSLQPDIAPLPNIAGVSVETPTEGQSSFLLPLPPPSSSSLALPTIAPFAPAKTGSLSPTSSMRHARRHRHHYSDAPMFVNRSHWYRYPDHHCCHPKNCFHACCHRPTYWNGYR